ncbi:hypothetical protein PC121_g12474 [Phytophthora cactorum]|nr:hypothetical protein PC120_g13630 [Phytophthora cactorum]KAG3062719.1 hypothetical protein PC121_g12474 [Phytophthora cactorum]
MPTPAVCSEGGDDDQTEPSLKRQRQGNKKEIANMQHVRLHNASKTERRVEITERLGLALNKDLTADGVRKHVDKLEKDRSAQRRGPWQESKGSIDENELERLMEIYLQKKDDKTLVQTKRTEAKTKTLEEDRAKGIVIREVALSTVKHTKKKSKPAKTPSAVAVYAAEFIHHQDLSWQCAIPRVRFNLDEHDRSVCRRRLRLESHEIRQILPFLNIPDEIYISQGSVVPREEAFCLPLRRLTFPARREDLRCEIGRSTWVLSSTINTTASLIYDRIKSKMNFDQHMVQRYKERSAEELFSKVGRLSKCIGFTDGQTCRPVRFEE